MAEAQQIMAVNVGLRALGCLFACGPPYLFACGPPYLLAFGPPYLLAFGPPYLLAFGKTRAQRQPTEELRFSRTLAPMRRSPPIQSDGWESRKQPLNVLDLTRAIFRPANSRQPWDPYEGAQTGS